MKFALVDGRREEAKPSLSGQCPACARPVMSKCGEVKVWHWAHSGKRVCDPWWENETEWHRNWKGHFPRDWQEVVHLAEDGEKHIADVKTDKGLIIEFQHSSIKSEERQSREQFYKNMIWIVDGMRRTRDKAKFLDDVTFAARIDGRDDLRLSPGAGPLLRDWGGRNVLVMFDFGDDDLWGILPRTQAGNECSFKVNRKTLIDSLLLNVETGFNFDSLIAGFTGKVAAHEWRQKVKLEQAMRDPWQSLLIQAARAPNHRR